MCVWDVVESVLDIVQTLSGEVEWLQGIIRDEETTYQVVKRYKEHRKMFLGQSKPPKFALLELKNEWVKATGINLVGEGELMCKRYFVRWSTVSFFVLNHLFC